MKPIFLLLILLAGRAWAGVEEDWQKILELDVNPKTHWQTREEARAGALAYMDRQEKTLRDFIAKYPADPRGIDAQLRLVHLLSARADLQNSARPRAEAAQILDRLAQDAPKEKRADIEFAKVSLFMRRVQPDDVNARVTLLNKAQTFSNAFPDDSRIAPLFAEVASLYDSQPPFKKMLLEKALAHASDERLQQRIRDDLEHIAQLGKPVALAFTSLRGEAIDVEKFRGKITLIYFFADWSPPSMAALDAVRDLAAKVPADRLQAIGISLDASPAAVDATMRAHKIGWPVFCDGKGWEGPLVRTLGINALPTLWLLDRAGRLRTLNARSNAEGLLAELLREP